MDGIQTLILKRNLFADCRKSWTSFAESFLAKTSKGPWSSNSPCGPQTNYKELGNVKWPREEGQQATAALLPLTISLECCGSRVLFLLLCCISGLGNWAAFGKHGFCYQKSITLTHTKTVSWLWSAFIFIKKGWVTCEKKNWPCKGIPKEWHIFLLSINTNSHGDMVLWC